MTGLYQVSKPFWTKAAACTTVSVPLTIRVRASFTSSLPLGDVALSFPIISRWVNSAVIETFNILYNTDLEAGDFFFQFLIF